MNQDRLRQLEKYLETDPNNLSLLGEVFDVALQCAEWERAEFHLRHGQALAGTYPAWALKEGDFWLAQGRYDRAREQLDLLAGIAGAPPGFMAVVLHNLAFIDLREGLFAACVERLAPHMEQPGDAQAPAPDAAERALQLLWLRALHRAGDLERACVWAKQADGRQLLDPGAAGVASLIAIDASDLASARRWVAMALNDANPAGHPPAPIEAFVTQATLSLAQRRADLAVEWSDRALALNPQDGRAWSARAFALMLDGKLDLARRDFARALEAMPGHIGTWHGQGWAELLMRDMDAAEKSFATALAMDRNFAESHGGLAVVMALKQRTDLAREHAEIALRIDRTNMSGRYAQAILDGGVNDAEAIRKLAHRLLSSRDSAKGQNLTEMTDGLL